jgi:hypothetical protein
MADSTTTSLCRTDVIDELLHSEPYANFAAARAALVMKLSLRDPVAGPMRLLAMGTCRGSKEQFEAFLADESVSLAFAAEMVRMRSSTDNEKTLRFLSTKACMSIMDREWLRWVRRMDVHCTSAEAKQLKQQQEEEAQQLAELLEQMDMKEDDENDDDDRLSSSRMTMDASATTTTAAQQTHSPSPLLVQTQQKRRWWRQSLSHQQARKTEQQQPPPVPHEQHHHNTDQYTHPLPPPMQFHTQPPTVAHTPLPSRSAKKRERESYSADHTV